MVDWDGGLRCRRPVTKAAVGADGVVVDTPSLDQDLRLAEREEDLPVQQLVAEAGVEAFDAAVLPRRSRLDEGRFGAMAEIRVLTFYNDRGSAEQHLKEGEHAPTWKRLSCMRFAADAVRVQLHALARNFANVPRTLPTPATIETWSPSSPSSPREQAVKTDARLARHARYATFQFVEAALHREVFADALDLMDGLRGSPAETVSA